MIGAGIVIILAAVIITWMVVEICYDLIGRRDG